MSLTEKWRKKTDPGVLVDAVRLNEDNVEQVAFWCRGETVEEIDPEHPDELQLGINVSTVAGTLRASLNMYVINYGTKFFVSHNRPFEMKFEPVFRPAPPLESAGDAAKERGFADPWGGMNSAG